MPQPSNLAKPGKNAPIVALVALGGNLASTHGGPAETLPLALAALAGDDIRVTAQSRVFRTPCFPPGAGPDFVNAAASIVTHLSPDVLLARLHGIEAEFDRTRDTRWGARTLDLDLLAWGDAVLPDRDTVQGWIDLPLEAQKSGAPDRLILPHPRLQDRAFVLIPLAEVAPDWRHPILGKTVEQMLNDLPEADKTDIVPL